MNYIFKEYFVDNFLSTFSFGIYGALKTQKRMDEQMIEQRKEQLKNYNMAILKYEIRYNEFNSKY